MSVEIDAGQQQHTVCLHIRNTRDQVPLNDVSVIKEKIVWRTFAHKLGIRAAWNSDGMEAEVYVQHAANKLARYVATLQEVADASSSYMSEGKEAV